MMRRRSFMQTLAGSGAGVALLKLGTPQKRLSENASVAWTVKGFTCVTCAVGLQTILEKHEGIARVKAEYPSGKVEIGFDSNVIESRELKRLIEEDGLAGITSNPTIFEKAIGESASYDADIARLVGKGETPLGAIYERIATADIAAAEGVRAIAAAVGGRSVTALVHAAAIEGIVSLADTTRPVFDRLVAVNLAGPFFLTQALRPMLADGSGIVFVSSVSALHGRPRHAAYAATKAALLGLSTSLAAELAPRVRVNCVAPGATDTPMMAEAITAYLRSMDAEEAQRTGTAEMARVLLGRVGNPAELAAAIVHLALDASYSTGSVVTVDGGYSAS